MHFASSLNFKHYSNIKLTQIQNYLSLNMFAVYVHKNISSCNQLNILLSTFFPPQPIKQLLTLVQGFFPIVCITLFNRGLCIYSWKMPCTKKTPFLSSLCLLITTFNLQKSLQVIIQYEFLYIVMMIALFLFLCQLSVK